MVQSVTYKSKLFNHLKKNKKNKKNKTKLGTIVKGSNQQRPDQIHVNSDRIQCLTGYNLSLTLTTATRYFQKE